MRLRLLVAAVLGAALLSGASAQAESVRFPETGDPAFVVEVPDGWAHRPDGDGNMLVIAANHSASLAFTIGAYDGTLDELGAGSMKSAGANPPQNMGPTQISGYRGYMYDSDMINSKGIHVNAHMVAVKLDAGHIASVTLLTIANVGGDDYAAARAVLNGVTLTASPAAP